MSSLLQRLHALGIGEIPLQPTLDALILKYVGLDDESDEIFLFYTTIMEKRSKKISGTKKDSVMRQALKIYVELIGEKKKRKQSWSLSTWRKTNHSSH